MWTRGLDDNNNVIHMFAERCCFWVYDVIVYTYYISDSG